VSNTRVASTFCTFGETTHNSQVTAMMVVVILSFSTAFGSLCPHPTCKSPSRLTLPVCLPKKLLHQEDRQTDRQHHAHRTPLSFFPFTTTSSFFAPFFPSFIPAFLCPFLPLSFPALRSSTSSTLSFFFAQTRGCHHSCSST